MLMSGSLGMVASTLPVQWLMPLYGWRVLFLGLACLVILAMLVILVWVPAWQQPATPSLSDPQNLASSEQRVLISKPVEQVQSGYAQVWRNPYFRKMTPVGFFCYGGLLSVQTLWAVPWMIRVSGFNASQAATGLFWINVCMLFAFWLWGLLTPRLARRGLKPEQLMAWGLPASFVLFAMLIVANNSINTGAIVLLAAYCVACTFVSLAQPAVGLAFPSAQAGRALSAYNLVIFSGVFAIQWGIGLMIDALRWAGWSELRAYQGAFTAFLLCCIASYLHFVMAKSHNQQLPDHD
jgi:predicted MFS family arabinose efflux permease